MANNNETTTKFKVDISELKAGITEANRQIKLANAQFKAASAGMDDWSKSADGLGAKIKQTDTVLNNQKAVLTAYEKQLDLIVAQYGENSAEADNMRIKIANQQAAVAKTEKSLGEYKTALVNLETEQQKSAGAYDTLKAKINEQEQELSSLKNQYKNVVTEQGATSTEAQELAGKIGTLSSKLSENKSKLNDAENAADQFDNSLEDVGEKASNTTNGGLSVFGVALGNLVANVVSNAINKMKELVSQTIEVGKNFDTAMSKVGAVSGATGSDLETLRNKAKEMGSTTQFTASEAAEAFNYMAMAGWGTEDMLNGIEGVLSLAAASGSDLGTTSDIVTDALTAMGYSAKDAGRLADVMAAASSNANTNVELMGATFQYAAPVVGALGYSMEDTAEQIGLMANAGIKGEKAGTALRSILTRLSAPSSETASAMEALGISLTDSEGNMKTLDEVMGDLRNSFSGLSETQKTQYAKQIAGQEAMSGLLAIVNAAPADVDKLSNAISNADGAAAEMAKTMQDNLGGDMTKLGSQFEGVQIAIYEKFEPALRAGVGVLSNLLDAIDFVVKHSTEFISVLKSMAVAVGTYVAYTTAITVMRKGWMALAVVQKVVTAAQWAMNAAMSANPIGLIIAAIAGLVVAFVTLWKKSDAFRAFWINLWEGIKTTVGTVVEGIKGFFVGVIDWIKNNWQNILLFLINPFAGLFNLLYQKCEGFRNFINGLWEGIKGLFSAIGQWFTDNVVTPVSTALTPLFSFITQSVNNILGLIRGTWALIQAVLGLVFEWVKKNVITPVKKAFSSLFNSIKTLASSAWNGVKAIFTGVKTWFTDNVVTPVKTAFSGIWSNLKNGAFNAWNGVKEVFGGIATWFKDKFSAAWTAVKNVFSTGGKVFEGVKDGIVDAFKSVVNAIIRGINKVISIPFKAINKILKKIKKVKVAGIQPFKDMIDELSIPQIPELETGGVLKKGQVGLLEGNGAEAVVPLDKNKLWISKTAKELKKSLANEGMTSGGGNVTNYTFNQTNNSPKPLNRLEIYRQTKNQIAFAKGV